jgi:predicted transposase/invertase (TIGR01784 family)
MPDIRNPHDHPSAALRASFFRATFARHDVAADFARHYLPPNIVETLDLETLQPVKDSFVDDELRDHFTDLLYETRLQADTLAYVYLLFEHKSYSEPWVAFQLLRYMVRIWEYVLEQRQVTILPPIIPLVVYHGEERWRVDRRFHKLVTACPPLADYVPDFRYELYDLSTYSDEELVGAVNLQVVMFLLKHIFDKDWHSILPRIMRLLKELARAESGLAYVEQALRYLAAAARTLQRADLEEAVQQTFPKTGGALMQTIAQTWVEEGIERGAVQATRDNILELLEIRFGTVPDRVAVALAGGETLAQLKAIHRQAAMATSLSEFEMALTQSLAGDDEFVDLPGS